MAHAGRPLHCLARWQCRHLAGTHGRERADGSGGAGRPSLGATTTEAAAGPVLYGISNGLVSAAGHLDSFYDTAMPPAATNTYYSALQGVLDGSVAPADAAKRLEDALKAGK